MPLDVFDYQLLNRIAKNTGRASEDTVPVSLYQQLQEDYRRQGAQLRTCQVNIGIVEKNLATFEKYAEDLKVYFRARIADRDAEIAELKAQLAQKR